MYARNLVLVAGAMLLAGCSRTPANTSIEGDWDVVFYQDGQKIMPKSEYKDMVFTFKKGKVITTQGSNVTRSQYSVNDSRDLKEIDLVDGGAREEGVYEISGDELTIVTQNDNHKRRPNSLEPGPDVSVMKLRRK